MLGFVEDMILVADQVDVEQCEINEVFRIVATVLDARNFT